MWHGRPPPGSTRPPVSTEVQFPQRVAGSRSMASRLLPRGDGDLDSEESDDAKTNDFIPPAGSSLRGCSLYLRVQPRRGDLDRTGFEPGAAPGGADSNPTRGSGARSAARGRDRAGGGA